MPRSRLLLQRTRRDSIREFRAAAAARFQDGEELADRGRNAAAIYLWGYAAEMTLKAAYFKAFGWSVAREITMSHLRGAKNSAITSYGVKWKNQKNLHEVRSWATLLVNYRSRAPGVPYPDPDFGKEVKRMGRLIKPIWSETLRYRGIVANSSEVDRMRLASGWLLKNSDDL